MPCLRGYAIGGVWLILLNSALCTGGPSIWRGLPVPADGIPIGIFWDKMSVRSPSSAEIIPSGIIRPFFGASWPPHPARSGDRLWPLNDAIHRQGGRIRIGLYTGQYRGVRPKRPKNSAAGREYAKRGIFRGKGRLWHCYRARSAFWSGPTGRKRIAGGVSPRIRQAPKGRKRRCCRPFYE